MGGAFPAREDTMQLGVVQALGTRSPLEVSWVEAACESVLRFLLLVSVLWSRKPVERRPLIRRQKMKRAFI